MEKYSSLVSYFLIEKPEAVVNFFGFLFTAITFAYTIGRDRRQREDGAEKDRVVQHRRNYLNLEFEASRIFQVCVDNPEIPRYLRGDLPESTDNTLVAERAYWFICQTLNVFEIIISFRREGMVGTDLFATWISWFYELGTTKRFQDYWVHQQLWAHYKEDLQKIINVAQALRLQRPANFDKDEALQLAELAAFHRETSKILNDESIEAYFVASSSRNRLGPPVAAGAPNS